MSVDRWQDILGELRDLDYYADEQRVLLILDSSLSAAGSLNSSSRGSPPQVLQQLHTARQLYSTDRRQSHQLVSKLLDDIDDARALLMLGAPPSAAAASAGGGGPAAAGGQPGQPAGNKQLPRRSSNSPPHGGGAGGNGSRSSRPSQGGHHQQQHQQQQQSSGAPGPVRAAGGREQSPYHSPASAAAGGGGGGSGLSGEGNVHHGGQATAAATAASGSHVGNVGASGAPGDAGGAAGGAGAAPPPAAAAEAQRYPGVRSNATKARSWYVLVQEFLLSGVQGRDLMMEKLGDLYETTMADSSARAAGVPLLFQQMLRDQLSPVQVMQVLRSMLNQVG